MQKTSPHKTIEYQCDYCGKYRVLIIPLSLVPEDKIRGYSELFDIHTCQNSIVTAYALFVDSHSNVRSQSKISSKKSCSDKEETFGIPLPKKSDIVKEEIPKPKGYSKKIIKRVQITDKLRNCAYTVDNPSIPFNVQVVSKYNLIIMDVAVSDKVDLKQAERWLKETVDIIETRVYLDSSTFSNLILYLEQKIKDEMEKKDLIEIQLLITKAVIKSTKKAMDDLQKEWRSWFPHWSIVDLKESMSLLELIQEEQGKSTRDVFEALNITESFGFFVSNLKDLISYNIVSVEKMEFVTLTNHTITLD